MYSKTTNEFTTASKLEKRNNDNAVNVILSAVSELVALLFGNLTSAKDMWNTLINKFEGNTQIKRTKLTGLETKFEASRVNDGESIDEMYNRLLEIQNDFIELGESLSNNKIVGKILLMMLREPRGKGFVSTLEALSGKQTFTQNELFAHLQNFKEKLGQADELEPKAKVIAFSAQNGKYPNQRLYNFSKFCLSNNHFLKKVDHESSKDAILQGMLEFEQKYNKKREKNSKRVVCFSCKKQGHTIQKYLKHFPENKKERGATGSLV